MPILKYWNLNVDFGLEYIKPYNCVQIICIQLEYLISYYCLQENDYKKKLEKCNRTLKILLLERVDHIIRQINQTNLLILKYNPLLFFKVL